MRRFGWVQLITLAGVGLSVWLLVAVGCLFVGSTGLFLDASVFWPRLEVVLLASLVGAGLAGAGVAYQSVLRNPLADPFLLGASSGAALMGYIWRFGFATQFVPLLIALGQQGMAFAGAMLSVGIVLVLSMRRGRLDPLSLILIGVIMNTLNGALLMLINQLRLDLPASGSAMSFLIGSLQGNLLPQELYSAAAIIGVCLMTLWMIAGALSVATLGETEAQSLGVRIHLLRWLALGLASLATAAAVAVSGPIGFIGLLCPHIARLLAGHDVRRVMPLAIVCGAVLLCLADAATRALAHQAALGTKLPVGVLTALLGGPAFLLLLRRQRAMGEGS